eukprot:gnl/MRDRNA2_/MRDRNA2_443975_c0_seq1.p1 gnl/MRDRNA2_/MRDRNA2_443975_c0~~gnl/MRDRNA2_/MRDRNA2_443975_c0_seq1.p1  ORF type:complete len:240 (+),score=53.33 gnl/MRDRNA2_/MRDRNA2_443975_c0_seq1:76-720(+)
MVETDAHGMDLRRRRSSHEKTENLRKQLQHLQRGLAPWRAHLSSVYKSLCEFDKNYAWATQTGNKELQENVKALLNDLVQHFDKGACKAVSIACKGAPKSAVLELTDGAKARGAHIEAVLHGWISLWQNRPAADDLSQKYPGHAKKRLEDWRDCVRESGLKPVYRLVEELIRWADFFSDDAASSVDSAEHSENVVSALPPCACGLPHRMEGYNE